MIDRAAPIYRWAFRCRRDSERERGGETERQGEKGGVHDGVGWGASVAAKPISTLRQENNYGKWCKERPELLATMSRPPPLTPPPPPLNFHLRIFGCLSSRTGRSLAVRVIEKECVWVIQVIASSPNEPGPPVVATLYMLSLGSRYRPATSPPPPPPFLPLSLPPPSLPFSPPPPPNLSSIVSSLHLLFPNLPPRPPQLQWDSMCGRRS